MRIPHLPTALLLSALFQISAAHATLIEAWVVPGALLPSEAENLNQTLEQRELVVQIADPAPYEIDTLQAIHSGSKRTLVMRRFPSEDVAVALTGLRDWGLTILEGGYPTAEEVLRLRAISPTSLVIGFQSYAGPEIFSTLKDLPGLDRGTTRAVFSALAYPRFMDRDSFRAAPPGLLLEFFQDYWPQYTHMDLFNMIPQKISLRVRDQHPSQSDFVYVGGIQRLQRVSYDHSFPLTEEEWNAFGDITLRWNTGDSVPSDEALIAFSSRSSEKRSVSIDTEEEIPAERQLAWSRLGLRIEWVRTMPGSRR